MYLEIINNFQDLILVIIINMFLVLRNNMSNESIIYILFSYYYYEKICNKNHLLPKIHLLADSLEKKS